MSARRITLSTVGLPSRIRRLAGEGLPLVLAVSLHAPDEATRRRIIPTAHAHAIDDIIASLHEWQAAGGRRVTIEYTLLAGVNDDLAQAKALAALLDGLVVHVNLIPFNPWTGSGFSATGAPRTDAFAARAGARRGALLGALLARPRRRRRLRPVVAAGRRWARRRGRRGACLSAFPWPQRPVRHFTGPGRAFRVQCPARSIVTHGMPDAWPAAIRRQA
jgi:hypothetical protein